MEKCFLALINSVIIAFILCSCSTFQSGDQQRTICNELKSKIIFNGNTSNTRRSEFQNAEDPMLQRQYEKYHCDQLN